MSMGQPYLVEIRDVGSPVWHVVSAHQTTAAALAMAARLAPCDCEGIIEIRVVHTGATFWHLAPTVATRQEIPC